METRVKKSVVPVYLFGASWLLYGALFPLTDLSGIALCALLSASAYLAGRALFPDKQYSVPAQRKEQADAAQEKPDEPRSTGNADIDRLIQERERAVGEMRRLNASIQDPKLSAQIDHLEDVTRKIIGLVVEQPGKLGQIRQFMNYYLPTTLKLLNAYDRMGAAGIEGENITAARGKVEGIMDTIVRAFDKQLDALYGEEAMDVSTDITVLEQMLRREGLDGSGGAGEGIRLEL